MALQDISKTDLWFTADGDFLVDGAGDLKDTDDSGDRHEAAKQFVMHRLFGERRAWALHPEITAGLEQFIGKSINEGLLSGIQVAVHNALTSDSQMNRDDYKLRVIELTPSTVAIFVYLNLPGQEQPLVTMAWNVKYGEVTRVV